MDLCDSNVWLSLALSEHIHHRAAREWFEAVSEPRSVAFCRATQHTLLRLLTTAAVLEPYGNPPLSNREAWRLYEAFAADDRVVLLDKEPAGLEKRWVRMASTRTASPKLWMDAYLVAFASAAGCGVVTTDTAFEQLAGEVPLRVIRASPG